ncbi:DUF1540 domain-containing protein [Carbonactinospora thermoautotrophica]|nr:DUF1540 domain-containing protein [Carbonactinospora thermoautotrophica]
MPLVNECAVDACAYNRDRACHALAITIGDLGHAHCDTFFSASIKGGDPSAVGHVGACKMADCEYNVSLECQAPGITVGYQQNAADCLTYQRR